MVDPGGEGEHWAPQPLGEGLANILLITGFQDPPAAPAGTPTTTPPGVGGGGGGGYGASHSGSVEESSAPFVQESIVRGGISLPVVPDKPGWIGAYPRDSRILRIQRFVTKRKERVWEKVVKYDVRKSFADQRLRVKGRFVKKEDEVSFFS